jgi:hypothetical protein
LLVVVVAVAVLWLETVVTPLDARLDADEVVRLVVMELLVVVLTVLVVVFAAAPFTMTSPTIQVCWKQ